MKALWLLAGSLALPLNASAVSSPASVVVQMYAMYLSTSADCSNPFPVFDGGSTPMEFDMMVGPTIGGGNPPDGTYPCLIMKMADKIRFRTTTAEGSCAASTEYTIDICKSGQTYTPVSGSGFGSAVSCSTSTTSPEQVYIYLSTQAPCASGCTGSMTRPDTASASKGMNLGSAFVVAGATAGTFVLDFSNKIDGSGASCDVQPPRFSFR
jgi:hypothetical protein